MKKVFHSQRNDFVPFFTSQSVKKGERESSPAMPGRQLCQRKLEKRGEPLSSNTRSLYVEPSLLKNANAQVRVTKKSVLSCAETPHLISQISV